MKILVVAPHMDDEILGAGGAISRHVAQGDYVSVCVMANRAYDHRYDPEAIEKEKESARRAQSVLQYQQLHFLDLPDERLDRSLVDLLVPLERVYFDLKPDVVYTCHRGDVNQDHQATFQATLVTCRPVNHHSPQRFLCYEVPSSTDQSAPFPELTFYPNHYVQLSSASVEKKLQAMRCYTRESRPFPHPRSSEGILATARKRGSEVSWEYAEAFQMVRDLWR